MIPLFWVYSPVLVNCMLVDFIWRTILGMQSYHQNQTLIEKGYICFFKNVTKGLPCSDMRNLCDKALNKVLPESPVGKSEGTEPCQRRNVLQNTTGQDRAAATF